MLPLHDFFISVLFPPRNYKKHDRVKFEAIRVNVSKWDPTKGTEVYSEYIVKCTIYLWRIRFTMYLHTSNSSDYITSLYQAFTFSSNYASMRCRKSLADARYLCDQLYNRYYKPQYTIRVTQEVAHCAGCTTDSKA